MKRTFRLLNVTLVTIALFSLVLSSCGGSKKENGGNTGGSVSLSISSLNITAGSTGNLSVTAGANWSATPSNSDVTVSPSSGSKGTTPVTISVKSGASAKSYTVVFKSGKQSATLTITVGGSAAAISISPTELNLDYENNISGKVTINCSGNWTINTANKPDWITKVDPVSGSGNKEVTITTSANSEKVTKTAMLQVTSGSYSATIIVNKGPAPNNAPTKATNLSPTGSNADRFPEFTWTASTDADGEEIKYTVLYSTDNSTWKTLASTTTETFQLPPSSLEANSTYYWKVMASDGFDSVDSDVVSFTTGTNKQYYDDCESVVYQEATIANPVVIIYTGEGYTQNLYKKGGQFDTEIDAAIEALFVIEPYKTYKHYFTVYKIAAYSNEEGMSEGNTEWDQASTKKDTRFHCSWAGGNSTGIGCDIGRVLEVITEVPGMKGATNSATLTNLSYSPTSIIINTNKYAGTNIFYRGVSGWANPIGGFGILSVAQTPARHPTGTGYGDSWNTLRHEFGGHGFGLLADEYVYYSGTIPDSDKANRQAWKAYSPIGVYGNVTFNNDPATCEWSQFIGRDEYVDAAIGLYAGALMYQQGVWRSEASSCMIDNRPHFNTQSRWQIYRRIKLTAGETPTLEDFIANDNDKVQSFAPKQGSNTKSDQVHMERLPYPPIMYDEWGRRVK